MAKRGRGRGRPPRSDLHPVHRDALDNGLQVVVVPLEHLHTATISLFVKVGSRYETPESNGLSHVLEHMVFRGTESHPSAYALNLAIEELGGTFDAATHVDFTVYQTPLPPENVEEGLALFAEMFCSPVFQGIEIERRVLHEEILEGLDESGNDVDADNIIRRLMFGDHPLGYKITGSLDNVRQFDEANLREHMAQHYVARNMVLCVTGPVDPNLVLERTHAHLGALAAGQRNEPTTPSGYPTDDRFTGATENGSQTDLRLSFPTFGLKDKRFVALQMLGRVLDDGLASRLNRHLCDDLGLAYHVFGSLEPYEDCGVLDLGAHVEHAKSPDVLRELLQLVGELRDETVEPAELERVRRRYLWDLRSMLDDGDALASFYGTSTLLDLADSMEKTIEAAHTVTPEQVREVAEDIFAPGRAYACCVGMLDSELADEARAVVEEQG